MKHALLSALLSVSVLLAPSARAGVASELGGWYVLPAVASTAGEYGTFFRTDLTLVNPYVAHRVDVRIWLLRSDADNTESPMADVRLEPGETRVIPDVVHGLFGVTGGASLVLFSADGLAFGCTARSYTGAADTRGFAGTGHDSWHVGRDEVVTPGLRNGNGYRTNVGIVSTSTIPVTVDVNVYDSSGGLGTRRITVPPYGRTQFRISEIAPDFADAYAVWSGVTASSAARWIPFATVIDNASGDSVYLDDLADRSFSIYESRYDIEGEWRGSIVRPGSSVDVTVFLYQTGPRVDMSVFETATGAPVADLAGFENKGAVEVVGTGSRLQCLADALVLTGRVVDRSHLDLEMDGVGCYSGKAVVALVKHASFPASARENGSPLLRSPRRGAR